ncbi:MAG: hypothetical protein OHK0022_32710 [Roseiflexaceae bacterium]
MSEAPLDKPSSALPLLLAAGCGAVAAALLLPAVLPALASSLSGSEAKAAWYLARAGGLVAYSLVWLATLLGLLITNRFARLWPGGPVAFEVHQHASLLGTGFALFHAVVLLGDRYIGYQLWQIALPFAGDYRPLWVGLGQIGFYLLLLVGLSFYVKQQIGPRTWRAIHVFSFAVFGMALLHGLLSGSDSSAAGVQLLYWASGGSVLFLTLYRALGLLARPDPAGSRGRTRPDVLGKSAPSHRDAD